LRPRADAAAGLRLALASGRAGGALLGAAVIGASLDPPTVLALIALALLLAGGSIWAGEPGRLLPVRVLASLATVALARAVAGPAAAAVAAVLLALGFWLQVRMSVAISGLAVFGAAVALLGRASPQVVLVFWLAGSCAALARPLAARLRRSRSDQGSEMGRSAGSCRPPKTVSGT
jgi:hypothetical protein